jgi:hypothetical protein
MKPLHPLPLHCSSTQFNHLMHLAFSASPPRSIYYCTCSTPTNLVFTSPPLYLSSVVPAGHRPIISCVQTDPGLHIAKASGTSRTPHQDSRTSTTLGRQDPQSPPRSSSEDPGPKRTHTKGQLFWLFQRCYSARRFLPALPAALPATLPSKTPGSQDSKAHSIQEA